MEGKRARPATKVLPFSVSNNTRTIPSKYRDIPKLTKEQVAQRRSEVIKYYNDLSRKKVTPTIDPAERFGRLSPLKSFNREISKGKNTVVEKKELRKEPVRKTSGRCLMKEFDMICDKGWGDMPTIEEKPVEEAWEEIKTLTRKLSQLNPKMLPKEEVDEMVDIITQFAML